METGFGRDNVMLLREKLAWLPLVLFSLAIIVFYSLNIETSAENPFVVSGMYLLFCCPAAFWLAFLAAKEYIEEGKAPLVFLGAGMLVWGCTMAVISAHCHAISVNERLTINNIGLCLSGFYSLICAILILRDSRKTTLRKNRLWIPDSLLIPLYVISTIFILFISWLATHSLLPAFYISGRGPTFLRQIVLGIAVLEMAVSTVIFWIIYLKQGTLFLRWYSAGLALLTMGMFAGWVSIPASPLNWIGRSAQFLAGIYIFTAVFYAKRSKKSRLTLLEEELKHTKEILSERQRFYNVLEILPAYVMLLDKDYYISFANKFFRERFGESNGRRCYEYLFNKDAPCQGCQTYNVLETNIPHQREWKGPDGRSYDIYDFPFKDTDGSKMILEMGIDITDRKKAQKSLLDAQVELERSKRLSDIGVLAATVAHELRNPLAAIGIVSQNIKRKINDPNIEQHLENIDKKIAESDRIINNLLFYSRLKPPNFENVSILDILEESIDSVKDKHKKNITLIRAIDSLKNEFIEVDSIQIKEVFNNILNNAYDALPEDKGEIQIISKNDDTAVRFIIKDNGYGIDKDNLGKVFDPFFTTKARGTGLGLSVCRQIVDLHNGTISIESETGRGTAVIIHLPKRRNNG